MITPPALFIYMSSQPYSIEMSVLSSLNVLLGKEGLIDFACYILTQSDSVITPEQRARILYKLYQADESSQIPVDGFSSDTLLMPEDATGEKVEQSFEQNTIETAPAPVEMDTQIQCTICKTWHTQVQCGICKSWHTIDSAEGLPENWECALISKMCRPPKRAEDHWPASRAKRFIKYFDRDMRRAPNHMKCLQLLAKRKSMTLDELYVTSPEKYLGEEFVRNLRNYYGQFYSNSALRW